jgi:dTDP-4-dehydrorhamnose reductase
LGTDLVSVLSGNHKLFPFDMELDITDFGVLSGRVADIKPDIIVNAAAYADVDGCESNGDMAYAVNAIGPQNLALAARSCGATIVTVSTDFVFDGRKGSAYDEFDTPNPQSVYGRSKLAGERLVRAICPEHFIVRTAWLFGRSGNNFVKTMIRLADEKGKLKVVDDQTGSPTYSLDLARRIAQIMETGFYGTYHATNSGACTWYEFAKEIIKLSGRDATVKPIGSKMLDRPAARPEYSVLENKMAHLRGLPPMRGFRPALAEFMIEAAL